jgi:putative ABC transport system permease protein
LFGEWRRWISQYSYRITWWPWIIVAGILVLLISFVAVVAQSWMASNENPVNNIKQE